ncbi:hypothetical protein ABH935_009280 [Catenulispora sp. GAS73]|uniref:hypothetical protein n=1 Tax=Catenulispora sp. GAS73 TaxID=3156269 RepID=UPI0035198A45
MAIQQIAVRHGWRTEVWQLAMDAALRMADPSPRIHAHRLLGSAYADLDRPEEGVVHLA